MTDTEKAALCARIDELCAEVEYDRQTSRSRLERIDQLKAENERLRQELEGAPRCSTCDAMLDCDECLRADASQKERKRLAYENAKMRELVRDMWNGGAFEPGACYEQCAYNLEQRTRELGIEVGG